MRKLDSDLLRTFLAIADTGSISSGAVKIRRSQSAASLQLKQLESVLETPLFERRARGVVLSAAGEKLEPVARRTVALLDATLAEFKTDDLAGRIRLGIPDDYSQKNLAPLIAEFSKTYPAVEVRVHCASGANFAAAIADGTLDLALYEVANEAAGQPVLRQERTFWVSSRAHTAHEMDPLPIALFDHDCWWRDVALDTLRQINRAYRIVYTSESVAGVAAAIEAGIAIGLMGESSIGKKFRILRTPAAFNDMPVSKLILARNPDSASPPVDAMADTIRRAFSTMPA